MTHCCCCPDPKTKSDPIRELFDEAQTTAIGLPEDYFMSQNPCMFQRNDEYEELIDEGGALPSLPPNPPVDVAQFSPPFSGPNMASADCVETNTNAATTNHDPDSITSIPSSDWASSTWDGVTTYSPCTLNKTQLFNAVWPSGNKDVMRGLRELFYSVNPFADNSNPTVGEIDAWNEMVINHYRRLLGIPNDIHNDWPLYLQAQWAAERKFTTYWDSSYPGTLDSPYGPCVGGTNAHCGASFIPNCSDQAPYLKPGQACVTDTSLSEGVFTVANSVPWSVKMSRILANIVQAEGITGHGGPFVSRPLMGLNWKCGSTLTTLRIKFGGPKVNPC